MPKPVADIRHARHQAKAQPAAAFKRKLAQVVSAELAALARRPVKDVVDTASVRRLIREWRIDTDYDLVADLVVASRRGLQRRLRRQRRSLLNLLGPDLADDAVAIIREELNPPPNIEAFVADLMGQHLVRTLLTNLIFTAIATFYQRVNPLFGALTTNMLEGQIKRFIGTFMPTIQRQAIAFVCSRANRRLMVDFMRAITELLIAQPLFHYADLLSASDSPRAESLLRTALRTGKVEAAVRWGISAAWDDLYARVRDEPLAAVIGTDEGRRRLTRYIVDLLDVALSRPDVARTIEREITRRGRSPRSAR